MLSNEDYLRIKSMPTNVLEENLDLKRFNAEKAAVARTELAHRKAEAMTKIHKENLESTKAPAQSLAIATWGLFWATIILAILGALSLLVSYIRR